MERSEEEDDPTPPYLCNVPFDSVASKICDGLYLSGFEASLMYRGLKRHGVTHILTVAAHAEMRYPEDFIYKRLPVFDTKDEDLLSLFESSIDFINEGMKKGGVLVHCMAGVSRSPTIVAAWLMKENEWGTTNALLKLKKKRHIINPNESFMWQLHLWEAMHYTLDGPTPSHKQYMKWKKRTEDTRKRMRERSLRMQRSFLKSSADEEDGSSSGCALQ